MSFHLGKPILVMMLIGALCGAATLFRPAPKAKDLTFWVFADAHFKGYEPDIARFEKREHVSVDMQIVQVSAMGRRLQAIFADELTGPGVPDVVEVEINEIGRFFRPPLREIGFEPLQPYLEKSGWFSRIVASRFAPWSKEGVIFGVPHDVHPVGITYREDLFREAGIDLSAAQTWPELQQSCLQFERYWRRRGNKTRHAIELFAAKPDVLLMMLLQRGINPVDDFNRIYLSDPKVAATIAFYAQCVAGPNRIGGESGEGDGPFTRDLQDGNLCAFLTADWRLSYIKRFGGDTLRGKLRFMPLPRFDPTDAPTATYGGTMVGILRSSKHKLEAWKLIEQLYFDAAAVEARRQVTHILPPIKTLWADASYRQPDEYFGGQHIDEMLVQLAAQMPPRYVTPATKIASLYLVEVLTKATRYVETHGTDGLEPACQKWLNSATAELALRMKQWQFDDAADNLSTQTANRLSNQPSNNP